MEVLDHCRRLRTLMGAPVQDRDVIAAIHQTLHDVDARRARSSDDETGSHLPP